MIRFSWQEFEKEWGVQLDDLKHILSYINSYPKSKLDLLGFEFECSEKIGSVQKEWINLINNFSHPDDISFFKQYWVPIAKNRNDIFLDLSSKNYFIFEARFFHVEINWYRTFFTKNINELLLLLSDNENDSELNQFRLRNSEENKEILDLLVELYTDNEE